MTAPTPTARMASTPTAPSDPCESPLFLRWVRTVGEFAFEVPPACEGLTFRRRGDVGLTLFEGDHERFSTDAVAAIAFRDASGVGMATADRRGRYFLHVPSHPARIWLGRAPTSAQQWGLDSAYAGPDGWWIFTFASWVTDDESLRLPRWDVFFVPRATRRAARLTVQRAHFDVPVDYEPVLGGLEMRFESDGRVETLLIRLRSACAPAAEVIVTPPNLCQSWPSDDVCLGRC